MMKEIINILTKVQIHNLPGAWASTVCVEGNQEVGERTKKKMVQMMVNIEI